MYIYIYICVLQCVAVCCSVLQCVAVTLSHVHIYVFTGVDEIAGLPVCVAVCCSVLQCIAVCCSVLQCVAVCCSALQLCHTYTLVCVAVMSHIHTRLRW